MIDVNAALLQLAHFVGHGLVVGVQRRDRHGDDVRLAGKLPQLVDLPGRRAVVHLHDGLETGIAQFEVALAGDHAGPHGVPIGRIAIDQHDHAFLARAATTHQQHQAGQHDDQPTTRSQNRDKQGCLPELKKCQHPAQVNAHEGF